MFMWTVFPRRRCTRSFRRRGKIINFFQKNSFSACGQACIAMIADKPIESVIRDMGTDGPTSIGQLIEGEYPHGAITSFLGIYTECG